MSIIFIFKNFANFLAEFFVYSGSLVALADNDILKFIRLEIMIKTIQFINIQNGIWFIKLVKNQNVLEIIFSISQRAMIQLAFRAIYGPIIKLNTVIGTNIMKYSFSVDECVLKETEILQHAYIIRMSNTNSNNTKVNCHEDKKLAYFA